MTILAGAAPAWAGRTAGLVAAVVFIGFAAWVVLQRVRHGRGSNDEHE